MPKQGVTKRKARKTCRELKVYIKEGDTDRAARLILAEENKGNDVNVANVVKAWGLKRSTLDRHIQLLRNNIDPSTRHVGPPRLINEVVEVEFFRTIRLMSRYGIACTKWMARTHMAHCCRLHHAGTSRADNPLAKNTFETWLKKNKDKIVFQKARNISEDEFLRATFPAVLKHFDSLGYLYTEYPLLLSERGRIMNIDETDLENRSSSQPQRVVMRVRDETGVLSDHVQVVMGDRRFPRASMLGAVCADGTRGPTLFCSTKVANFPDDPNELYRSFELDPATAPFGGIRMAHTQKGVMHQELFWQQFFEKLLPFQRSRFPLGPLLFIFDQATAHNLNISVYLRLQALVDVLILFLPAGMTIWVQPLDQWIFGVFKRRLREMKNFLSTALQSPMHMLRADLSGVDALPLRMDTELPVQQRTRGLLDSSNDHLTLIILAAYAWASTGVRAAVERSFAATGICPFNAEVWRGWTPSLQLDELNGLQRAREEARRASPRLCAARQVETLRALLVAHDEGNHSPDEFLDAVLDELLRNPVTGWSRSHNMMVRMKVDFAARAARAGRGKRATGGTSHGKLVTPAMAYAEVQRRMSDVEDMEREVNVLMQQYQDERDELADLEDQLEEKRESVKRAKRDRTEMRKKVKQLQKSKRENEVDMDLLAEVEGTASRAKKSFDDEKSKVSQLEKGVGKKRRDVERKRKRTIEVREKLEAEIRSQKK